MTKIKKVITCTGHRPVLVTFQNGRLLENSDSLESCIFEENGRKMIAVATKKHFYSGYVNSSQDLCNIFIGIHNVESDQVKLVQVDTAIVSLKQKSSDDSLMNTSSEVHEKSMDELKKTFGSKRAKKVTQQNERHKINFANAKDDLENTVADIVCEELPEADGETEESTYLPPINRNATDKTEVYSLHKLVPSHILESLLDEAAFILKENITEDFTPFLLQCLKGLKENDVDKCAILLYVHYMLKCLQTPARSLKKAIPCPTSKLVNDHILDTFTVNSSGGRSRPLSMRDKSLCYTLILCMFVLDFQVNVELLSKDINVGLKKIVEISKVLALTVKDKTIVVLRLPLPAPVQRIQRKRK